ncbi:hypothetical protein ACX3YG_14600 [Pseudomonas wadenswilerensis]
MKLIIDSNKLQSEDLRSYLKKSKENYAVLTDFSAIEAYKKDPLKSIFKSMSIVSEFPNQVIILKSSIKICGLSGRKKGLQKRLIDESQTKGFHKYISDLRSIASGDKKLESNIREHGKHANDHLDKMLYEAEKSRDALITLGNTLTKEERALIRNKGDYTSDLINKVITTTIEMSNQIFINFPHHIKPPCYKELPNTFIFRTTLASYLIGLYRFCNGGLDNLKAEKLRNDYVDMILVAYATYFDGVLSSDKTVNHFFDQSRAMLYALFDAEVPSLDWHQWKNI